MLDSDGEDGEKGGSEMCFLREGSHLHQGVHVPVVDGAGAPSVVSSRQNLETLQLVGEMAITSPVPGMGIDTTGQVNPSEVDPYIYALRGRNKENYQSSSK